MSVIRVGASLSLGVAVLCASCGNDAEGPLRLAEMPEIEGVATGKLDSPTPFWLRAQNVAAAARVLSGPTATSESPRAVKTLKSRTDELARLRARLGATDRLPINTRLSPRAAAPVLTTGFDRAGRITRVNVFGAAGLTTLGAGEDPARAVKRFVLDARALYDFQGSTLSTPDDLTSLSTARIARSTSPRGRAIAVATLAQTFRGTPILNGDVIATFWDGKLMQLNGRIINAAAGEPSGAVSITASSALALAQKHAETKLGRRVSVSLDRSGIDLDVGGVVHHVQVDELPFATDTTTAPSPRETYTAIVNARTGAVVDMLSSSHAAAARAGRYQVTAPRSGDNSASVETRIVNGYVSVGADNHVIPWLDVLAGRSPLPVYQNDPNLIWGGAFGHDWHMVANGFDFLHAAGHAYYQAQHASYWVQRASRIADLNFRFFRAHRDYEHQTVTTIIGTNGGNFFGSDGCWGMSVARASDGAVGQNPRVGCIRLDDDKNRYNRRTNVGNVTTLGTIFHEFGHAVDWKYHGGRTRGAGVAGACDTDTAEEASSLAEAVATLFAQTVFLNEFGAGEGFRSYDATSGLFSDITIGSGNLAGNGNRLVHMNQASLQCFAAPDLDCKTSKYQYGAALVQAYWESAHGRTCHGEDRPCTNLNDGAGTDQARWAFFFASQTTARDATYREFVAAFLGYYFHDVSETAWGNRWWIFNHHDLVGPAYGYSPCHND